MLYKQRKSAPYLASTHVYRLRRGAVIGAWSVAAAFAAATIFMIVSGMPGAPLFGPMALLAAIVAYPRSVPGRMFLRVDREGLEFAKGYRTHRIDWSDIEEIRLRWNVPGFPIVMSGHFVLLRLRGEGGRITITDIHDAPIGKIFDHIEHLRHRSRRAAESSS
jgi:hypothetical protein